MGEEPKKNPAKAGFFQLADFVGRGDMIRTCDLYVPNVALYQAELHPGRREPRILIRACRVTQGLPGIRFPARLEESGS